MRRKVLAALVLMTATGGCFVASSEKRCECVGISKREKTEIAELVANKVIDKQREEECIMQMERVERQ